MSAIVRSVSLSASCINIINHHHHHHHVHEGLGVFPVPWSSRWSWSLHLFLGRPMFLRPFGLYCNACFGILFVSILSTCCSHFSWYCFISFTVLCAPVFSLIHWFFSLSSFVGCLNRQVLYCSSWIMRNLFLDPSAVVGILWTAKVSLLTYL